MHTIKIEIDQKELNNLNLEILRETYEHYNKSSERRIPKWQEDSVKFENPRLQFLQMSIEEFSIAFATQLRKLIRRSNLQKLNLLVDNMHKIEITPSSTIEEIYENLKF